MYNDDLLTQPVLHDFIFSNCLMDLLEAAGFPEEESLFVAARLMDLLSYQKMLN